MPDAASPSFDRGAVSDPGPENRLFYPALDGLRAMAFLMVFGQHYIGLSWGWTGVDIFFVLSGFLITGILFDTQNQPHRVWNFYIRRTLRIFPLYYGIFLLVLLAGIFFKWRWDADWLLWPLYVGNFARFVHPYVPNSHLQLLADAQTLSRSHPNFRLYLGHFWSLCVEEQFYLFWPWVVFFVRDRRRLVYICLGSVILSPFLRVLGQHTLPSFMLNGEILYRVLFFRTDALLLGGLLALLIRGGHGQTLLKIARVVFAACFLTALLWFALNPYARTIQFREYPAWTFTWGLSFIDLFAASMVVMALEPTSVAYRVFNMKTFRWIGRISYGAYVLHDVPHAVYFAICKHLGANNLLAASALGLTCTLFMASISYRFFESPFIRLKERLSR